MTPYQNLKYYYNFRHFFPSLCTALSTIGTTWHTAGIVVNLRTTDLETNLISITRETLLRLEKETGVNPGWINNGGMMIAPNKVRVYSKSVSCRCHNSVYIK